MPSMKKCSASAKQPNSYYKYARREEKKPCGKTWQKNWLGTVAQVKTVSGPSYEALQFKS